MTSSIQQAKPANLTLSEKYGLRFYTFLIPQILILYILIHLQSVPLAMGFVSFYNSIGNYLPIKAKDDRHLTKIQNNNQYLLGPLIVSCLSTPIIMAIVWHNFDQITRHLTGIETFVSLFAIGFTLSGSIDAAHELLHRPEPLCKFFAYLNLFFLQFTIYPTEHLYLHHKKVGTLEDPITAPKNKSLYGYYFGALFGCYRFNYGYSRKIFGFNVACTLLFNVLAIGLAVKDGSGLWKGVYFSLLCYFTLFIMEAVEYIEHYGLVYRSSQKQRPVNEICSWNTSENQLLNWLVFRFQRHSDHHMNAYKIYPTLDLAPEMPQFPFDFVSGMVMALVSPLWFSLINPLAEEVVEGKPVAKEHRDRVKKVFGVLNVLLVSMFPLRLIQYFLL